jgi:hypothetical protein
MGDKQLFDTPDMKVDGLSLMQKLSENAGVYFTHVGPCAGPLFHRNKLHGMK